MINGKEHMTMIDSENMSEFQNFKYYLDENNKNKVVLSEYIGHDADVVVPATVLASDGKEYEVSRICAGSFYANKSLVSISIPENVDIFEEAFCNCSSLKSVHIDHGIDIIDFEVFEYCESLVNIVIPNSVTNIYNYAFDGCSSLKNIALPDSIVRISAHSFMDCTSLASITIPRNTMTVESGAFYGCTSLTEILVDEGNIFYTSIDGVLFSYDKKTLVMYPPGKADNFYRIPNGVTEINEEAFHWCSNLEKVFIPDGVLHIGNDAFEGTSIKR